MPQASKTRPSTRQWLAFLSLAAISTASLVGCSLCCAPYDYDYPVYGGIHQRANPTSGRVGSILSDPFAGGALASADSNLKPHYVPENDRDGSGTRDDLDLDRPDGGNEDDIDDELKDLDSTPDPDLESIDPLKTDIQAPRRDRVGRRVRRRVGFPQTFRLR